MSQSGACEACSLASTPRSCDMIQAFGSISTLKMRT